MNLFKEISLLCVLLFSFIALNAETEELKKKLADAQNKFDSVVALIDLSEHYRFTYPEQGLKFAKKALGYSLSLSDTVLMIRSSNALAILQKENSLNTTAKGTIIQSLAWSKRTNNNELLANAQLIAGHIYSNLNEADMAISYYNKCLETFLPANDSVGLSYTYSGLGIVYYDNERYEEALESYLNAEKFWVDDGLNLKSDLWNNIGALFANQENYKGAKYYYKQALLGYDTSILTSEISMVYYNLGELEMLQKNYLAAKKLFNKSLQIGRAIESPTEMMWAYEGLYLTAKEAKNFKEAISAHESYTILKDSLDFLQNRKDVMEMEKMYHQEENLTKIKDQELKIVQAERKIDSEKFKNIIYVSVSIFIGLICFLGLILYFRSRKMGEILLEQRNTIAVSLKEKEVLLKEIHHRVKNNLQIISSLLSLQHSAVENDELNYILNETQNRINAIALVHQKLYQSKNVGQINFSGYLNELVEKQSVIYFEKQYHLKKTIDVPENATFDIDLAVSLGLITSELVINAFKYAFAEGENNKLTLRLTDKKDGNFSLEIRDSGKGLPPEFVDGNKDSLGMDLVKILAKQIDGSLDYKFDNGAVFTINFSA